jgi:hypothetical protein
MSLTTESSMSILRRTVCRLLVWLRIAAIAGATLPSTIMAATPVSRPSPLPAPAAGDARHAMDGESLVIEAEGGEGDWERIEEAGEQAIRAKEGARMSYRIRFPRPGVYYVHLRSRLTVGYRNAAGKELEPSSTNDAVVTVGGARLYGSDGTTRPEGMRCHGRTLRWTFLPKGPGSHTPDAIRNDPVHTFIPQAGVYELVIGYRSPAFVIDKIALTTRPLSPP